MALALRKIQKIGNSSGVVLPVEIMRAARFKRGSEVTVQAEDGKVTLLLANPGFDEQMTAAERFIARHPNTLRKLAE
jgi:putative addiction module antidote